MYRHRDPHVSNRLLDYADSTTPSTSETIDSISTSNCSINNSCAERLHLSTNEEEPPTNRRCWRKRTSEKSRFHSKWLYVLGSSSVLLGLLFLSLFLIRNSEEEEGWPEAEELRERRFRSIYSGGSFFEHANWCFWVLQIRSFFIKSLHKKRNKHYCAL